VSVSAGLREELAKDGFDHVFEIVKKAVQGSLGARRAGLALVLAEIPNYIGAYHVLGSNLIVLNKTILRAVELLTKSKEELNSFLFSILTHEYLHSLGHTDEGEVRRLVHKVSVDTFGADHYTAKMAVGDFMNLYPELRMLGPGRVGEDFELIKDFDKSSMPYIG